MRECWTFCERSALGPIKGQESVENLWVKINGKSNIGSILGSMCYRPSDQE